MRELRLVPASAGGGKRSDAARLRDQMLRLFAARISFQVTAADPHRHGVAWVRMEIAPAGELWWDPKQPGDETLWGSWIELGDKFFQAIVSSPVPLDMRALRALRRSPLALDLYAWASYKSWVVNKKNLPQFVPWERLMEQLGADYDPKRFQGSSKNQASQSQRGISRRPLSQVEPGRPDLPAGDQVAGGAAARKNRSFFLSGTLDFYPP